MKRQFKSEWRKRTPAICMACGAKFQAIISEIRRGGGKYCSRQCQRATQARMNANAMRSPVEEVARRRMRRAAEDPKVARAHDMVEQAIRRGDLTRQPCEVCGDGKAEAHHEDYDYPLDVMWLCRFHHKQRHKELRAEAA